MTTIYSKYKPADNPLQVFETPKKTSPCRPGVKSDTNRRQQPKSDFKTLVTRMKPQRRPVHESLLRFVRLDARNSPVKNNQFKSLLESWELTSNTVLTPANPTMPKLKPKTDSQSEHTCQKSSKIGPGMSHAIGPTNSEIGASQVSDQSRGILENQMENSNFWGKSENCEEQS